jgi:hypothetical protein
MVDYKRISGRSDCDNNVTAGMSSHLQTSRMLTGCYSQLRQMRGNSNKGRHSNYVLPRVVRLTVETNVLTGTLLYSRITSRDLSSHLRSASVAIISLILYVAFPVSSNDDMMFSPADMSHRLRRVKYTTLARMFPHSTGIPKFFDH